MARGFSMKAFQHLAIVFLLAVGCSGSSDRPDTADGVDDAVVVDTAVTPDHGADAVADAGRDAANDVAGDDLATGDVPADQDTSPDTAIDVDDDPDGVGDDSTDPDGTEIPEDAAGDVTADLGGDVAVTGFCTNEDDQSIIQADAAAIDAAARDCYLTECSGKPEPQMCNVDCVSDDTGLSPECAGCYAYRLECTLVNCMMPCMTDFGSQQCRTCQDETGCTPAFQDCAGT